MVWPVVVAVLAMLVIFMGNKYHEVKKQLDAGTKDNELLKRQAILENQLSIMKTQVDKLPTKVLESITSSSNNYKGRLAELIGYMRLNAQYDKVIPFGDITDFIGIKFSTDTEEGSIDFIDVKNGPHAKLTRDQGKFKKLIEAKRINFVKVRVDTKIPQDTPS